MMKRLITGALFVASVFSSHAHAQSWKQMQWGLNTATSPYQVGVNLAGSWYQVATLTSSGAFSFVFPSYSCASSQWVSASNSGGFLCSQPAFTDVSGSLPFSRLSGSISAAQLIAPGASTFGAVKSSAAPSNQYATGINTSGVVTYAQPAFTNLSGSLAGSQLPAFTGGDCTTSAGSVVISCATLKAANSTWSGANTWTNSNTWSFTDAQNIGPGNFYTPWFFSHTLSAGATGYRNSVVAQIQTGVSVAGDFIVPLMGLAHLTAGSGNAFGSNSYVWVDAAAASTARASGGEFNTDIRRNITDKTGVQIVDVSTSTGTASGRDAGVWVATQTGGAGYKNGLEFSFDGGAAPVRSAGSLITGSGYTVTNGIDFSGVGFTGALIKSSNASIDGQGNVIAPTFISVGTAPTITGSGSCTLGTVTGGKTSGRFQASAICATGQTYTITLPSTFNGWNCRLNDRTTSGVVFQQTSDSATTAVLTVRSVAVANSDVIDFVCTGY